MVFYIYEYYVKTRHAERASQSFTNSEMKGRSCIPARKLINAIGVSFRRRVQLRIVRFSDASDS